MAPAVPKLAAAAPVALKIALCDWFNKVHEATGRFDQKAITNDTPKPVGLTAMDALAIVVTMVGTFDENPKALNEIMPTNPEAYTPCGMGRAWCEFENSAFIREMSILSGRAKDTNHDTKIAVPKGRNLFTHMSRVFNVKYGMDRSAASCKNQWYRELRARSGIDERGSFRSPARDSSRFSDNLRVSLTSKSRAKKIIKRTANRKAETTVSPVIAVEPVDTVELVVKVEPVEPVVKIEETD